MRKLQLPSIAAVSVHPLSRQKASDGKQIGQKIGKKISRAALRCVVEN